MIVSVRVRMILSLTVSWAKIPSPDRVFENIKWVESIKGPSLNEPFDV